ncbi:MAG: cytochrome c [Myxococcota bacterium]
MFRLLACALSPVIAVLGVVALGCSAQVNGPGESPTPADRTPGIDDPGRSPRPGDPPVPGHPPVPGSGPGVLHCPTVEAPAYTLGSEGSLSTAFATSCASCHGARGEGQAIAGGTYPAIPGDLTFEEFRSAVRSGRNSMPAFSSAFVSDDALRSDYAALQAMTGESGILPAEGEWAWSEADVEAAYQRGMQAWREPDHEGVACANCHSPDAVDLAVIGYTDDAILRRSGLHIPPELAATVVDLVHAQRRRFNITEPCSRDWRPLQPGGRVLPGDTPEEQDQAYAEELLTRNLTLVSGVVETLDDAQVVFDEMARVNLRDIPMGIALPRWTEDTFNGEEHSSINDYLMGVGRVPNNPTEWYALEDRYINDPSDENFYELLHRVTDETNDMGFAERIRPLAIPVNGRCGRIRNMGGLLSFTDENKRRSLLIVQHYMRKAALGQPSWLEEAPVPLLGFAKTYGQASNPFYNIGAQFAEYGCGNAGPMLAEWPAEPAEEIPADDLANGSGSTMLAQLNHPWQTLGTLYDPSLLMQEDFISGGQNLHYWAMIGFEQDKVHLPFMYFHRIAVQDHYYARRGTETHPEVASNFFNQVSVHPLLDGQRLFFRDKSNHVIREDTPRGRVANSIRCNGIRALMLRQRPLFAAGEPGYYVYRQRNQRANLIDHYRVWEQFANALDAREGPFLNEAFDGREALCTSELVTLINEVRTLAQAAEDRAPLD